MNNDILNLEPKAIWKNFSALNSVPRPSKKEEKVRQFIIKFGEDLGLPVETDEVGNVLIKKAAYPASTAKALCCTSNAAAQYKGATCRRRMRR